MKNRFAILGGTGTTGIKIADLLLEHSDATIKLLARNKARIDENVEELNLKYKTDRISGAVADAGDEDSLIESLKNIDMVVVASGTAELVETVAYAALKADVDYLDIQYSQKKIDDLEAFEKDIENKHRIFITDAGYHPGLPAAVVRYGEAKWGNIRAAIVCGAIKQDWRGLNVSIESKVEFVKELSNYEPLIFSDRKWRKASMLSTKGMKKVDFGEPLGKQSCAPMIFEELKQVPEQLPKLEDTGFYIAGFSKFTDFVFMPFIIVWMKIFKNFGYRAISKLMFWSLENSSKPPFRTVLELHARDDNKKDYKIRLSHADGYWFTAIPVVACLKQYMKGELPTSGLHCMGNIVEPIRIIEDMKKMGIETKEL